jgi:hypothetical protein
MDVAPSPNSIGTVYVCTRFPFVAVREPRTVRFSTPTWLVTPRRARILPIHSPDIRSNYHYLVRG